MGSYFCRDGSSSLGKKTQTTLSVGEGNAWGSLHSLARTRSGLKPRVFVSVSRPSSLRLGCIPRVRKGSVVACSDPLIGRAGVRSCSFQVVEAFPSKRLFQIPVDPVHVGVGAEAS